MARGTRFTNATGFDLGGRRRRSTLSMAPLIDFTFILLIFFMVVTHFDRFSVIEVLMKEDGQKPLPPVAREEREQARILRLVIRRDGRFLLDGRDIGDVTTFVTALARHGGVAGTAERPVLLVQPEGDVSMQLFVDAVGALGNLRGYSVRIVSPSPEAERQAGPATVAAGPVSAADSRASAMLVTGTTTTPGEGGRP